MHAGGGVAPLDAVGPVEDDDAVGQRARRLHETVQGFGHPFAPLVLPPARAAQFDEYAFPGAKAGRQFFLRRAAGFTLFRAIEPFGDFLEVIEMKADQDGEARDGG